MSDLPFFRPDGGDRFVATESTRGPWSPDHQHGGPPAALLARAMERLAGADVLLARATFDLIRPVPIGPLVATAELVRSGAKVKRLRATLAAPDGTPLILATGVALRTAPVLPAAAVETDAPPPPEAGTPFVFPFFFGDLPGYRTAMESRLVRGTWGKGDVALWMRARVPLVEGETPSPVQRVLVAADSASGTALVVDPERHSFVNADLTVALHRAPADDWICLDASSAAEPHGIGLTRARLWDRRGVCGLSLQSLLLEARR